MNENFKKSAKRVYDVVVIIVYIGCMLYLVFGAALVQETQQKEAEIQEVLPTAVEDASLQQIKALLEAKTAAENAKATKTENATSADNAVTPNAENAPTSAKENSKENPPAPTAENVANSAAENVAATPENAATSENAPAAPDSAIPE